MPAPSLHASGPDPEKKGIMSLLRRVMEPKTGVGMGASVGAGFLPIVGEAMDAGEIALGIADRDPLRVGIGALAAAIPFVSATSLRGGLRALKRAEEALPGVHPDIVKYVAKLKERIRHPEDLFDDAMVNRRLADPDLDDLLVGMDPTAFRQLAHNLDAPVPYKIEGLVESLAAGEKIRTPPYLFVGRNEDGIFQVGGHEGRHRMRLAEALGMDTAPVRVRGSGLRDSLYDDGMGSGLPNYPDRIIQEGTLSVVGRPLPAALDRSNVEAMLEMRRPTRVSPTLMEVGRKPFIPHGTGGEITFDYPDAVRASQKASREEDPLSDILMWLGDDVDGPRPRDTDVGVVLRGEPLMQSGRLKVMARQKGLDPSEVMEVNIGGPGAGTHGRRNVLLMRDRIADFVRELDPMAKYLLGKRVTGMGYGHTGMTDLSKARPVRRYAAGGGIASLAPHAP